MKQLQKHNIVSVIKHFPGQGASKIDSHYLLPSIKKIEKNNMAPFISAIHNGADIMMVGHMMVKNIISALLIRQKLFQLLVQVMLLLQHFVQQWRKQI